MKKRLLSLLICVFMLLPAVLSGCSGSGETIDITQNKASAITVTLYSIVEEGTTAAAVKEVENALNDITENKLNTHVILKFYTENEYYNLLNDRFDAIQEDMTLRARLAAATEVARKAARTAGYSIVAQTTAAPAAAPVESGDEAVIQEETVLADETKINEYGIADTIYPDEIEGQLDIVLINSEELYSKLVSKGVLTALEEELSSKSKEITGYVYPSLITSATIDGHTYAVPNNHMVGEYTYMLVNKSIADKYGYNSTSFPTAAALYDTGFLAKVKAGEGGTVLMLNDPKCTIDCATGAEGILGTYVTVPKSTITNNYPPEIIYGIPTYKSILGIKNEFGNSIVHGDIANYSAGSVATAFVTGNYSDMQKYSDDYYITVVDAPSYTMKDVCSSMYAVSNYSVSLSRSMEVISLLSSEPDVVNLLAYGIKDVNYIKNDNSDTIKLINNEKDSSKYYAMNPAYAGNQYKRYVTEDEAAELVLSADNWSAAKQQNLASVLLPYAGFEIDTTIVPVYLAENAVTSGTVNMGDEEEDPETTAATTPVTNASTETAAETEAPVTITYMPVADMIAGLDSLYKDSEEKIANFNGTDPVTGENVSFSQFLDNLTARLMQSQFVIEALDSCNSGSVIIQYNTFLGQN